MRTLSVIVAVAGSLFLAQAASAAGPLSPAEAAALKEPVAFGQRVFVALGHYWQASRLDTPVGSGVALFSSMPTFGLLHATRCLTDSDFALSRHYHAALYPVPPDAPPSQPILSLRTQMGELVFDISDAVTMRSAK